MPRLSHPLLQIEFPLPGLRKQLQLVCFGYLSQAWEANSLSRRNSKFRFISANDSPMDGPEGRKNHAHSEQPHPITPCSSNCTSARAMRGLLSYRRSSFAQKAILLCKARTFQGQAVLTDICDAVHGTHWRCKLPSSRVHSIGRCNTI